MNECVEAAAVVVLCGAFVVEGERIGLDFGLDLDPEQRRGGPMAAVTGQRGRNSPGPGDLVWSWPGLVLVWSWSGAELSKGK